MLGTEALVWSIKALEALAHERTVARLKQEFDEIPPHLKLQARQPPHLKLPPQPLRLHLPHNLSLSADLRSPVVAIAGIENSHC